MKGKSTAKGVSIGLHRLFGMGIRAGFIVMVLLALCFEARAQSFDGTWEGTTSQQRQLSITVVDDAITSITVEFRIEGSRCLTEGSATTTFGTPQPITGNTFSVEGGSTAPGSISYTVTGTFSSTSSSVSGNVEFTLQGGSFFVSCSPFDLTVNSNWNATNVTNKTLTVSKDGTGSGTVTSNPPGIDCGVDCTESYTNGTSVTLTASAASGSVFAGWSGGGCTGTGTCTVTMDADTAMTATFNQAAIQAQLTNISTRGLVQTGDNVQIGGFIIGGTGSKTVLIRARGPVLADFGVPGVLDDPVLQLFSGQTVIADNDNWETTSTLCQNSGLCGPPEEIIGTGLDPCVGNLTGCARESAILVTLDPGPYTAIVSGVAGGTGVGLVEVFEVGTAGTSRLTNISTRGLVGTGDDVMIGGFIIGGTDPKTVLVRARGPVLTDFGVPGELNDPLLQLFSGQTVIAQNDNFQVTDPLCDSPAVSCGGQAEIVATGLDPCVGNLTGCTQESAIHITLPPGPYTAIVSGVGGGTGVGLVEVFEVNGGP